MAQSQYDEEKKANVSTNDYENMRSESYRTLLNSEIQASVAKQNAMKYTQNQLNQTGYANQGVAQSTALGIENSYRNALADANNTYRQELMGIQEKENAYNQGIYQANDENLSNALYNALDENNNITDVDLFKKALTNWDATFDDNGNMDLSNSQLSESEKKKYQYMWSTYKEALDENGKVKPTPKTNYESSPIRANFVKTGKNKDKNFVGINYNFNVNIGGKTTKWEMGQYVGGYPNEINVDQAKLEGLRKQVGDMWVHENNGNLMALVKTAEGENNGSNAVRAVEAVAANKESLETIASLFNELYKATGNHNFEVTDATHGYITDTKTGIKYRYDKRGDGFIVLKKSTS